MNSNEARDSQGKLTLKISYSEDITIKDNIKQNYLEIYSQCNKFQIKEKRHDLIGLINLK